MPHPTLSTADFTLREYQNADLEGLKALLNHQVTMEKLFNFFKKDYWTDEDVKERQDKFHQNYLKGTGFNWLIIENKSHKVIGTCGFKDLNHETHETEFGVILHQSFWGTNAVITCGKLACEYGFETLSLNRIYMTTDKINERTQGFLKKMGIPFSKTTDKGFLEYEITKEMWDRLKNGDHPQKR
jgi:ribosomal-protein-alanine N-acetyltransferase